MKSADLFSNSFLHTILDITTVTPAELLPGLKISNSHICINVSVETRDNNGIWRSHNDFIIELPSLLTLQITDAHGLDLCAWNEVVRKIKRQGYWSPYHQTNEALFRCELCTKNNVRKGITTPLDHIPVPEGPFRHLVIDYMEMIKRIQRKRYMLVAKDRFSRWVETVPSKDQGA